MLILILIKKKKNIIKKRKLKIKFLQCWVVDWVQEKKQNSDLCNYITIDNI